MPSTVAPNSSHVPPTSSHVLPTSGHLDRRSRRRRVPQALGTVLAAGALLAAALPAGAAEGPPPRDDARSVMFVGNNHDGTADIIDATTFERLHRIDIIPDREEREAEIAADPVRLGFFLGIRAFIGQGNDQFVDDMFTSHDGRFVYASRPSFADVVGIDLASEEIVWRFPMEGVRSDHMAISPDGTRLLVSDSTGNKVHQLDPRTGEKTGEFPSGDSPHENEYYADASRILHASIGRVYTPIDRGELGPVRDEAKGEEYLQVVDADTLEVLERWDIGEKLAEFGEPEMSSAVRPMAIHPDERTVYFQVSFHHGFVEFDLETAEVRRIAHLPISEEAQRTPRELYLLDSAHHGLAIDPPGRTLCVAGTMDDYAAMVDVETFETTLVSAGTKPYWSTTGPTGEHCWVSYSGDDEVVVLDYATQRELARIDVGDHPQRVRAGLVAEDILAALGGADDDAGDEAASEVVADDTDVVAGAADAGAVSGPGAAETGVGTAAVLPATGGSPATLAFAGAALAAATLLRRRRPA